MTIQTWNSSKCAFWINLKLCVFYRISSHMILNFQMPTHSGSSLQSSHVKGQNFLTFSPPLHHCFLFWHHLLLFLSSHGILHWLHFLPKIFSCLHWHWPSAESHISEVDPFSEQSQGSHWKKGRYWFLKNPGKHWSHLGPPKPYLQMHWPVSMSQKSAVVPSGLQSHSEIFYVCFRKFCQPNFSKVLVTWLLLQKILTPVLQWISTDTPFPAVHLALLSWKHEFPVSKSLQPPVHSGQWSSLKHFPILIPSESSDLPVSVVVPDLNSALNFRQNRVAPWLLSLKKCPQIGDQVPWMRTSGCLPLTNLKNWYEWISKFPSRFKMFN